MWARCFLASAIQIASRFKSTSSCSDSFVKSIVKASRGGQSRPVLGKGEGAPVAAAHQTKLTGAPRVPTLNTMDVHFPPRLEKKLNDLAAKTGRAREQLLEDALAGYEASTVATLNWSQCAAVERVPGKVSGAWVLRGTRMPVATIFENLEAGANIDDLMEWFDGLDRKQVKAVIEFAARSLEAPASSR